MRKMMPFLLITILLCFSVIINGCADESKNTQLGEIESNEESENTQVNEIVFTDEFNGNIISPLVTAEMKDKLLDSIAGMKELGPGVGPWRIIYCNGDKIILYNYAHIVACDISKENKGIYSIIDVRGLKTGTYQGSIIALVYPSPDAMSCILGAGYWEMDIEPSPSLYL
jgi:hypothetical protein